MSLAVFGGGRGYHHHHHHHHHPSRSPRMPRTANHRPDGGALAEEEETTSRPNTCKESNHRGRGSVQQQTPLVEEEVGSELNIKQKLQLEMIV